MESKARVSGYSQGSFYGCFYANFTFAHKTEWKLSSGKKTLKTCEIER